MNTLTVLGSGTSTGVPILGCKCEICQSPNPANKRLRTSVFIETESDKKILIDASPDLRTQLLRAQVDRVDAAFITHDHADHTHGIDDLRPYCFHQKKSIPIFASSATAASLRKKFDYIFDRHRLYSSDRPVIGGGIPQLDLLECSGNEVVILEERFRLFNLPHGYVKTTGFRHSKLAYLVDCSAVPTETLQELAMAELDWLIIDCVRPQPHDTHMGYQQTIEVLETVRPKHAGLIHMGHDWDHIALQERLQRDGFTYARPLKDGDILRYS